MPGSQLRANPAAGISHLPEAVPVVAETAALSVLPFLLPSQPPLLSGDSALEPEPQAGGRERMREDGRKRPRPKPPMKRNKARFLVASPSPSLLRIFCIFDPLGHSSCRLTSVPLSPLFSSDQAPFFPCLPPNGKLLGLAGQWGEPEARTLGHTDTRTHAAFCLQRQLLRPFPSARALAAARWLLCPGKHVLGEHSR